MSYILDALKKSEREKNQGEVPSLTSFQDLSRPSRSTNHILLYLLITTLLINTLAISLWAIFSHRSAPTQVEPTAEIVSPIAPVLQPNRQNIYQEPPAVETAEKVLNLQQSQTALQVGESTPEPLATAEDVITPEPVVVNPTSQDQQLKLNDSIALSSQEKTQPATQQKQPIITPDASDLAKPSPIRIDPSPKEVEEELIIEPDGDIDDEIPDNDLPTSHQADRIIVPFANLPAEILNDLPELAISAHYYSADPSTRMASINGRIIRQGQTVTNGLILEEITKDGVVFTFRRYRFGLNVFTR